MAARPHITITKENERRAWEYRLKGWRETRIAEELGVNVSTISRMLQRVEKRLAKSFEADAKAIKARQTAQLEYIAEEAMEAWERSKEDAEIVRRVEKTVELTGEAVYEVTPDEKIKVKVPIPGKQIEEFTERRGQTGEPRHLDQARGAMSDIRDIWGLDAPKEQKVTGDPSKPFVVKVIKGVSLDDI